MFKKIILATLFVSTALFIYFFIAHPYRISGINGEKGDCMESAIKGFTSCLHSINNLLAAGFA